MREIIEAEITNKVNLIYQWAHAFDRVRRDSVSEEIRIAALAVRQSWFDLDSVESLLNNATVMLDMTKSLQLRALTMCIQRVIFLAENFGGR